MDPNNPDAVFPGVLAGWREDLQGKERRDSRQLPRDVFVTTNYGQVQGFKVRLRTIRSLNLPFFYSAKCPRAPLMVSRYPESSGVIELTVLCLHFWYFLISHQPCLDHGLSCSCYIIQQLIGV